MLKRRGVTVDFWLPLAGRPLEAIDRRPSCRRLNLPLRRPARVVPNVIVICVGRGFARERVLATKRLMLGIGEPPEHGPALWEVIALADEAEAVAVSDAFADFVRDGFVEEAGAGHAGSRRSTPGEPGGLPGQVFQVPKGNDFPRRFTTSQPLPKRRTWRGSGHEKGPETLGLGAARTILCMSDVRYSVSEVNIWYPSDQSIHDSRRFEAVLQVFKDPHPDAAAGR